MKSNYDFQTVINSLKTQRNASALIMAIDRFKSEVYVPGKNVSLDEIARTFWAYAVLEDMQKNAIDLQDLRSIVEYLDALKSFIINCPLISVEISRQISDSVVAEIYASICVEFGSPILLAVNVDSRLLGGMRIQFKGHIKDYSWNRHAIVAEMGSLLPREL